MERSRDNASRNQTVINDLVCQHSHDQACLKFSPMSIRLRLANRLILSNTQHPIDSQNRERIAIPCGSDEIEAWVIQKDGPPDVMGLKFPGTGGRAELAGPHPCELISDRYTVWTINPPGYGTSTGNACVKKMAATCEAAWQTLEQNAEGRPIFVSGNSLGCMYALYVAARFEVAGLFLRNPAPVQQLIKGKYSWWNAGLAYSQIASQVPAEMDAVENAKRCKAPAFFLMSEGDRRVPPKYQAQVFDPYAGRKSKFVIRGADHDDPIPEAMVEDYLSTVRTWIAGLNIG